MTRLIFITSGKINYTLSGKNLYQSIKLTSLGKKFPRLVDGAEKEIERVARGFKKPDMILTAPSNQALETAVIFSKYFKVNFKQDSRLLPLKFDISDFMNEEQFNKKSKPFDILRQDFIKAFFGNKLLEDNKQIKKRFKSLIKEVDKNKHVLIVSHAFLIKLFQVYSLIGDEMFTNKEKLISLFNPSKPPLERLETIEIVV